MKQFKFAVWLVLLFTSFYNYAQQAPTTKTKVKITGKVLEKTTKQPLEYATVSVMLPNETKVITGGITNPKGEFEVAVDPGTYDIKIEFISFKATEFKQKSIQDNTNLGVVNLSEDAAQLNEVVVRAEKSTVEIKLDKKVYNVGQDMIVKGGTVSDVLENVPSVSVDVEGNVSLRGNENVRIFIDGRPSNALNMAEALRQIPADAIDKVEVITNPSARYDAEGGAGILNIVLKKGKNLGFNGSFILSTGIPETYGASANLNYKTEKLNFFTSTGYDYRTSEGSGMTNATNLNSGNIIGYTNEDKETERLRKGISTKTGVEWTLAPNTYWTNAISYRNNNGTNSDLVNYDSYDENNVFTSTRYRLSNADDSGKDLEFTSNFLKNFNDKGHKLTIDFSYSKDKDANNAIITDETIGSGEPAKFDTTFNNQKQNQFQSQLDYVLPFDNGSQFEAGYKGNFNKLNNEYSVSTDDEGNPIDGFLSNTLEYNELINSFYTQYGFKVTKFSFLFGLRWEDTKIDINLLDTQNFNTKKYNNFFPSAFVNYEISDESSVSLSYSKRLSRPRGRFLNPATDFSSNINLFRGNPDLDPSFTDKYDVGYLKRWEKVTFSTSMYYENTKDVFSFVRSETGEYVGNSPVILSSPINLAKEQQFGFEFTLNYTPFKIWKINSSFNLSDTKTTGDYSFTNTQGDIITTNLNNETFSWFSRVNSRLSLPYKIDWQLSGMYFGPRNTAQGKVLGNYVINTAFSKDILKDKATIALNVSDLFNSRRMKNETNLESVTSYSEFQWRKRQINLSFTYRLNMKKTDRDKNAPKNGNGGEEGGGDFPG
ncbi:TonB-dependent receptor [Flavobacterium sp. GA093]|uniref:TonB-dependent receptor n=1 Tax=Flavobacterium hydrocarbonoxydans TaxID=2683249 RepID=A0A6I4NYK4_9FLAO|nr:TonB-dependent receptor [Flavobacterium hydrocarbonoxydans]MWB96117.1 TonB-dependent receptor [Flavobacterium hydrocarbonoxydans]